MAEPTSRSLAYHSAESKPRYPASSACVTALLVSFPEVMYTPRWMRGIKMPLFSLIVLAREYVSFGGIVEN